MKKHDLIVATIVILLLLPWDSFAGGSLFGTGTCPAPLITGFTQILTFNLQGPTPPPNGIITVVTGTCSMNGQAMPPVSFLSTNTIKENVGFNYDLDAFAGLPITSFIGSSPSDQFELAMLYPGTYGSPTGANPGTCTINVSWTIPAPPSTELTGPGLIMINQTVELIGIVPYAYSYYWTATGVCSIVGAADQPSAYVRGDREGACTVSRRACNSLNDCVTNSQNIYSVTYKLPVNLVPEYYLLLLK